MRKRSMGRHSKRPPHQETNGQVLTKELVLSSLQSSCVEDRDDYVNRGRRHASLSDPELADQWKQAVHRLAAEPLAAEPNQTVKDLCSELGLRGKEPPLDAAAADAAAYADNLNEWLRQLRAKTEASSQETAALLRKVDRWRNRGLH